MPARLAALPAFRARIARIGVLRHIVVPPAIVAALGGGTHIPVIARYAGEKTVSTLVPAGGKKRRLVLQMDVLRPAQLDAGDLLAVELAADRQPRHAILPEDLRRAFQFRPAAAAAFHRGSPSTRRIVIELLEQSRTPETRQRRLEKIIERLAENTAGRATKI